MGADNGIDQATNWGDWLSINLHYPEGNPNPDTFTPSEEGEGEEEIEQNVELVLEIIQYRWLKEK